MKKILIVFAVAAASYACGGGESEQSTTPVSNSSTSQNEQIGGESKPAEAAPAATADAGNGKALIEGSDCRTCHQDNAKVIGPSYADVAKKYPNTPENVKMLAEKVIKGGKGNWGEIPMTPHPNVSQADAEAMVSYILSMNK
jgi:cytochrome c